MAQILKISEASAIAIHALLQLTQAGGKPVQVKEIGSRFSVSEAHCSKVMQRLVRAGMVQALRGPRGGFVLTADPASATILDVYEAMEGPLEDTSCFFQVRKCADGCIFGGLMHTLNREVREHFGATTLRQAADKLHEPKES